MRITFENHREQSAMKAIAQVATEHGIAKLMFELGETVITSETRSERGVRRTTVDRDDETERTDNGRTRQTIQRVQYRWMKLVSPSEIDDLVSQPEYRRIARYLAKHGPATARQISDDADVDYKTVTGGVNMLRHMTGDGTVLPGNKLPRRALVVSEPLDEDN